MIYTALKIAIRSSNKCRRKVLFYTYISSINIVLRFCLLKHIIIFITLFIRVEFKKSNLHALCFKYGRSISGFNKLVTTSIINYNKTNIKVSEYIIKIFNMILYTCASFLITMYINASAIFLI